MDKNADRKIIEVILDNQDVNEETVWDLFDEKLTEALITDSHDIIAVLRPEMESDQALIKWVSEWKKIISDKGKSIRFISNNQNQIDVLKLQCGNNIKAGTSSQEELESIYSSLHKKEISARSMKNIFDNLEMLNSMIMKNTDDNRPVLKIEDIVTVTGEYLCQGCGYKDFFKGGDVIPSCPRADCPSPDSGWHLLFGLF